MWEVILAIDMWEMISARHVGGDIDRTWEVILLLTGQAK
jgi:hypothetical protein